MAKYVESKIGSYPQYPRPFQKPTQAPRDSHGNTLNPKDVTDASDDSGGTEDDETADIQGFNPPKCGDRDPSHESNPQANTAQPSLPPVMCDMSKVSGLPYNVFNGTYHNFCRFAGRKMALRWPFDSNGNFKDQNTFQPMVKRTPPPNPADYGAYTIALEWKPNGNFNPSDCIVSCEGAYAVIANSQCGHTASRQFEKYAG